jgi:hypothetical protein
VGMFFKKRITEGEPACIAAIEIENGNENRNNRKR